MKKAAPALLAFVFALLLIGCGPNPEQELSRLISKSLRDNEGISAEEGRAIADFVKENGPDEYLDQSALRALIKSTGQKMCERGRGTTIDCDFDINLPGGSGGEKPARPSAKKPRYGIYVENSGSMYGYMEGDTDFKHALMAMMTNINRYEEKQEVFFVNDKVHPVKKDLSEFINFLKPENLKSIGNTSASSVSKVLKQVTDAVVEDNGCAVVLSDFIFSLDKSGDTKSQLAAQKYGITAIIQNAKLKKKDYGFLILKFDSKFKGKYYNVDNKPIKYNGKRPYFMWIIAPVDQLKGFIDKYDVDGYRGFEDFALIYDGASSASPYYSILPDYEKKGRFKKADRTAQGPVLAIKDVEYDRRKDKVFHFSIAVDASELGLDDSYLSDESNYSVSSSADDEFEIVAAAKIDRGELSSQDKKALGKATHVVTLASEDISTGGQTVALSLNRELPAWVEEDSTTDDRSVTEGSEYSKTFGLTYLIEGVAEAYKPLNTDEQVHFKVEVEMKR